MKKDLKSFITHNKDYEGQFGIDSFKKVKKEYTARNMLEVDGFKKAINKLDDKNIHIDIGSGGGWLLFETSTIFKKVIGVEPSKAACDNVMMLIKEYKKDNIELINSDMTDAILNLNLKEPVFMTTAIVLSHIKDFYVKEFLNLLNTKTIPLNSSFYFCERYDKNIQQNLWYIRRKYWWAKNLSEWQLEFFDIENTGYKSGIYGKKVGKEKVTNNFKPTFTENILWGLDGIKQKIQGFIRVVKRQFKK